MEILCELREGELQMKVGKIGKLEMKFNLTPRYRKKIKRWKKKFKRLNWIPKMYHKRKHIGNAIYSIMYLAAKEK